LFLIYLRNVREAIAALFSLLCGANSGLDCKGFSSPVLFGFSSSSLHPGFLNELRSVIALEFNNGTCVHTNILKQGADQVPFVAPSEAKSSDSSADVISAAVLSLLPESATSSFRQFQRVPFVLRVSSQLFSTFLARIFEHAMNRTQMLGYERYVASCLIVVLINFVIQTLSTSLCADCFGITRSQGNVPLFGCWLRHHITGATLASKNNFRAALVAQDLETQPEPVAASAALSPSDGS
jgi:hypothetical protein